MNTMIFITSTLRMFNWRLIIAYLSLKLQFSTSNLFKYIKASSYGILFLNRKNLTSPLYFLRKLCNQIFKTNKKITKTYQFVII